MFRRMQIKLIVFYTSIVAMILVVTNVSVFFLLSTYNNHQLSRETEMMISSIQSSEWIKEDAASIDDVIIHEEESEEKVLEEKQSEEIEEEIEEETEEIEDDTEEIEEETPEDTEEKQSEEIEEDTEEIEEDTEEIEEDTEEIEEDTEEIEEETPEEIEDDTVEVEEETSKEANELEVFTSGIIEGQNLNMRSTKLNLRSDAVAKMNIVSLSLMTPSEKRVEENKEREVYFPSSNELYIPPTFDNFSLYYIYAEDGTLLKRNGTETPTEVILLEQAKKLLMGEAPKVIHIDIPIEKYYLVVKRPIEIEGVTYGFYIAARDVSIAYETVNNLALIIAASLVVGILGSILLGYLVSDRVMKPIKEAYNSKEKFLADASHELRTPISVVLLSCDAMENEAETEPLVSMIKDVKEEALLMRELVENLLILARHDSGRVAVKEEVLDMGETLKESIKRCIYLAEAKRIDMVDDTEGIYKVMGDSKLIQSAISIIIENAIKYTPAGGCVTTKVEKATLNRKNYISVTIKDTGRGMDDMALKRVFERFYRSDQARGKAEPGYGLGLSIAKEVIELHNGKIEVESIVGEGSTFRLLFKPI